MRPVVTHGVLQASLARRFRGFRASPSCIDVLLAHIAAFAGIALLESAPLHFSREFPVRRDSVARLGRGRQLLNSRSRRKDYVFRGGAGDFASLAAKPFKGKVVQIMRSNSRLDSDAIQAVLEADVSFTKPDEAGNHAWHITPTTKILVGPAFPRVQGVSLMHPSGGLGMPFGSVTALA